MGRVSFLPSQLGEGTPSPENVRPIVPGLVVESKNLFDKEASTKWYYLNSHGTVVNSQQTSGWTISDYIPVTPNKKLTYMGISTPGNAPYAVWYNSGKTFVSSFKPATGKNTITVPDGVAYVRFSIIHQETNPQNVPILDDETFIIVNGERLDYYEPYYEPITIYGGYVDFDAGEVVEEWTQTLASDYTGWTYSSSWSNPNTYCVYTSEAIDAYFPNYDVKTWICNILPSATRNEGYTGLYRNVSCFCMSGQIGDPKITLRLPRSIVSSVTEAINYMTENNMFIAYKLETPTTHSLTPSQLTQAYNKLVKVSPVMLDRRRRILMSAPHLTSASGQLATFQTDLSAPLKDMKVHFYPVQASGTPSPDNVLPISGWDGVTVTRCGKNLLDFSAIQWTNGYYLGNISNCDGKAKSAGAYKVSEFVPCSYLANQTVTIGFMANAGAQNYVSCCFYTDTDEDSYIEDAFITYSRRSTGLTVPSNAKYVRFSMLKSASTDSQWFGLKSQIDSYEPYTGISIPITFPQTIYGGYVDLVKGEVVEEYGSDGQPITPQAYPITPQTIKALKGINNIFSDANGNVDVTYWTH